MKKALSFLVVVIFILSCSKDDDSRSGESKLISFDIASCSCNSDFSTTKIEDEYSLIHIFSSTVLNGNDYPVSVTPDILVSSGATITPESNQPVDFTDNEDFIHYQIKSEDANNVTDWYAVIRDKQIPNSEFENWYDIQGLDGFYFSNPGKHPESTVWATANMGTSLYNTYGTTELVDGENSIIQIRTGETEAVPVTSGTLFLGRFDLNGAIQNPTNPEAATDFGVPFIYRPKSIRFNYKYTPGTQMIQGTLKDPGNLFGGFDVVDVSGTDKYKIYAALEVREGENRRQIAYLEIQGSESTIDMEEKIISFDYTSEETPTHIYIVFASSTDGHLFKGAVGSTLLIDDLQLIYE